MEHKKRREREIIEKKKERKEEEKEKLQESLQIKESQYSERRKTL
jgi:hypothetical protein